MSNFKRLCGITAEMLDVEKITNSALITLIKQVISKEGQFIYSSSRKGHTDHDESKGGWIERGHRDINHHGGNRSFRCHADDSDGGSHGDSHEDGPADHEYSERSVHTDHKDYVEHSESKHRDISYSEQSWHTDSYARHDDYSEECHTDKAK